ncbi:cytochrome b5 [Microthyrium microscopicum]|uniref:Cytochrome b5 n=1 Tax=Microthyrium microscopicum TaxID=703497 RepID=A0A6A6UN24_9PEZI|nr:cytochrome b5 [Microthyrium microscopicum]
MSDSAVRRRTAATSNDTKQEKAAKGSPSQADEPIRFGVLDILRILLGLFVLSSAMSWFINGDSMLWGWKPWFTRIGPISTWLKGPIVLTDAELLAFDGSDINKPIYVGLNGSIYDVSSNRGTYGPGGSYSFFAGRDAARGFITGCFKDDLTPDMRGVEEMYIPIDQDTDPVLSKGQMKIRRDQERRAAKKRVKDGIDGWADLFSGGTGKPYFYVGYIKREEGWLEKLPKRELCESAVKSRPARDPAPDPAAEK